MRNKIQDIVIKAVARTKDLTVAIDELLLLIDNQNVTSKLSFKEIEMLVQIKHYEDSDYGNCEKRCDELIEETRNKIGYTKKDVTAYLKQIG